MSAGGCVQSGRQGAHDPLRLLFAGFDDAAFYCRGLAVLQAYVDDSKKHLGRRELFLAGFVNTAENWIQFSNDWRKALEEGKPIKYFKAAEASCLRGQFGGWGKLDDLPPETSLT